MALFQTRIYGGSVNNIQGHQYDVTRDGRFLINTVLDDASSPITLLLNWKLRDGFSRVSVGRPAVGPG